ncbi:MAG: putative lipid II flippase FtsW [Pseudomonadota bacterium]
MNRTTRWAKFAHVNPVVLTAVMVLLVIGTVMVYSASSLTAAEQFKDSAHYLKRHLFSGAIGLVAMTIVFLLNLRWLKAAALPGLVICGLLLLVTALTSHGVEAKHATRWLSFRGFTFQPSEFAKPFLLLYVAAYLAKKGEGITDFFRGLLPLLLTVGGVLLLILRQPDFGTAVALALCVLVMLFVARARLWHIGGLAALVSVSGFFLIQGAGYRRRRLLAFLNPWGDPQGSGFQILQSFVAFQRGGLQGQGLGDGTQKLLYLPEAHTDFIYSVIAEELGILGCMLVIACFVCIVYQGFRLALKIRDTFGSQAALGLTTLIGTQAVLNMAVVTALVPTKGMTLPLVSYGGSSLIAMLIAIGILLSLSSTIAGSKPMARRRPV